MPLPVLVVLMSVWFGGLTASVTAGVVQNAYEKQKVAAVQPSETVKVAQADAVRGPG